MQRRFWVLGLAIGLATAATGRAEIIRGSMGITGSEMK